MYTHLFPSHLRSSYTLGNAVCVRIEGGELFKDVNITQPFADWYVCRVCNRGITGLQGVFRWMLLPQLASACVGLCVSNVGLWTTCFEVFWRLLGFVRFWWIICMRVHPYHLHSCPLGYVVWMHWRRWTWTYWKLPETLWGFGELYEGNVDPLFPFTIFVHFSH